MLFCGLEIKTPGMADIPGESQEEPSVMVVAITAAIRLTSQSEMFSRASQLLAHLIAFVTQHHTFTADRPSYLLVEIDRVKVLPGC